MLSVFDQLWVDHYCLGDRLRAETKLLALSFNGLGAKVELHLKLAQLHASYGKASAQSIKQPDSSGERLDLVQRYLSAGDDGTALRQLYIAEPTYPDPLLRLVLAFVAQDQKHSPERLLIFRRLLSVLRMCFPRRPDLGLSVVQAYGSAALMQGFFPAYMPASDFYTNHLVCSVYLQALWGKGLYERMYLAYVNYQLHGRPLPVSDYVLRASSVIGLHERVDGLFRAVLQRYVGELQPVSLSNMLFTALGQEHLDKDYVGKLVDHWRLSSGSPGLARSSAPAHPFRVSERPTLVVTSADLRMHPVGRFWLPIAKAVRSSFRLIHIAFNPHDQDSVRDQLKEASDEWYSLETAARHETDALLRRLNPELLLDLGGHTADNRPDLLNQRHAAVQATYLGFYGPSYGSECDWWILDSAIARRVRGSYPGSEAIWELTGPSLCYDPTAHGLPPVDQLDYSEPEHPVIGSFNHTRKITRECIQRFGRILQAMPSAVLQFRSHSFFDSAVRRWFLQQFLDAGIAPHQLQPLPYAPSPHDALRDYGRIHLHLDTFPVSGTTTTLDALAMGTPVLTCPNHLYAGAISAAILENAGLGHMVCESPDDLPQQSIELCKRYASAGARRALAQQVRASALCDSHRTATMFTDQLAEMLKRSSCSEQVLS